MRGLLVPSGSPWLAYGCAGTTSCAFHVGLPVVGRPRSKLLEMWSLGEQSGAVSCTTGGKGVHPSHSAVLTLRVVEGFQQHNWCEREGPLPRSLGEGDEAGAVSQ